MLPTCSVPRKLACGFASHNIRKHKWLKKIYYGNNVMPTRNHEMTRCNNENTSRKYDKKSLNNVMTGRDNEKIVKFDFFFFQMKSTTLQNR